MSLSTTSRSPETACDDALQAIIVGVPERAGNWEATVTVTDSTGQSLDAPVNLNVAPPNPFPPGWQHMYPSP